jgi:hypothetical protein
VDITVDRSLRDPVVTIIALDLDASVSEIQKEPALRR